MSFKKRVKVMDYIEKNAVVSEQEIKDNEGVNSQKIKFISFPLAWFDELKKVVK